MAVYRIRRGRWRRKSAWCPQYRRGGGATVMLVSAGFTVTLTLPVPAALVVESVTLT